MQPILKLSTSLLLFISLISSALAFIPQRAAQTTNTSPIINNAPSIQSVPKIQSAQTVAKAQPTQTTLKAQSTQTAANTQPAQTTLKAQSTQTAANTQPTQSLQPAAPKVESIQTRPIASPIKMQIVEEQNLKTGQQVSFMAYLHDKNGPIKSQQLSSSTHNHFRLTLIDPSLSQVLSIYPSATDNNGYYKFNWTFDKAGTYNVIGEVIDKAGNIYTPSGYLTIPGKPQLLSKANHIAPGTIEAHQKIDNINFSATMTSKKIHADQLVILDITAKHASGEFHNGLEPHMNQYARLIGVNEGKNIIIQANPISPAPKSATKFGGPSVLFKLRFPEPGFYRLWAQFQIEGKSVTVPYDVEVLP